MRSLDVGFSLGIFLMSLAPVALAEPNEEVAAAAATCARALGESNPVGLSGKFCLGSRVDGALARTF